MLKTLLELKEKGELKKMVEAGLMSAKVYMYLEIYLWIDARVKTTGKNITTVALDAEEEFSVKRTTVWTAIRCIRTNEVSTGIGELI